MKQYYVLSGKVDPRYKVNYGTNLITGNITRDGLTVEVIVDNSVAYIVYNGETINKIEGVICNRTLQNKTLEIKGKTVRVSEILDISTTTERFLFAPIGSEFTTIR